MLVDNAIVVTDGIRMKMQQGIDGIRASREVVAQTAVPLLGATVIAITAFAAIGTSQDSTGEYCRSLFTVILISLSMSWVTAVTITPLFCNTFLKVKKEDAKEKKDPYGGAIFQGYKAVLSLAIRARLVTVALVAGLFVLSLAGFGSVKQSFFPDSTRPQFYVDFFLPTGTHINETVRRMESAEEFLLQREGVTHVATMAGGGQPRFLLTYTPEGGYSHFAQLMVDVEDYNTIPGMMEGLQSELEEMYPDAIVNVRRFVNGPSTGGKIQLRIYGPETDVLRSLAQRATGILLEEPDAKAVRDEWGAKVKVLRPRLAEAQARRAGIDRPQLARAMETAVEGATVGVYREGDELLPIIARSPEEERVDFDNLGAVQVWSSAAGKMIPAGQVTTAFETAWEDPLIQRRNRMRMININADPRRGLPSDLFRVVKPKIEKALGVDLGRVLGQEPGGDDPYAGLTAETIPVEYNGRLPLKGAPGYSMAWGGEAESSKKAQGAMAGSIPTFVALMMLIIVFLFNSIKKTLIIWLTVPLCLIGVTAGLLLLDQPFGFMALLGLLSLSGMLIKNAIVLIDQIDTELAGGKEPFQAIVDSGVSRLIPVLMAALTTILGMLPLLKDAFFISMAVTIMFGLGFATALTLIFVPVLYAIFFRIPYKG
jgi:multidrug efflux pump subunit AcrB